MDTIKSIFSRFFGSRKMTLGIVGMGVIVVSNLAPELSPRAEQIGNLIFAVVGLVSGTIMLEDSMKAWANRPKTLADSWRMATEELSATEYQQPKDSGTQIIQGRLSNAGTSIAPPSGKADTQLLPKIDPPSMEGVAG